MPLPDKNASFVAADFTSARGLCGRKVRDSMVVRSHLGGAYHKFKNFPDNPDIPDLHSSVF